MGTLLRHGSPEQKRQYLPQIAAGELRLQSFAVTEPSTGTDTTKTKTFAEKRGDRYVVNGQKVWISRVQHSDLCYYWRVPHLWGRSRKKPRDYRSS